MSDYELSDYGKCHGFCDEKFEGVKRVFEKNLGDLDVGASVAVTVEGEFVVDLWGGLANQAKQTPWTEDTIVNVFSSTKTMAALCALILADREQLDLNASVARYWPEFAQNGKQDVLVRHVLGHTSGLSGFEGGLEPEQLYDWEYSCAHLAAQAPWWPPGTASGYHALTHGHLIGELVRRVDGRSLGTFFREEIAIPMKADFHIGFDDQQHTNIAELIPPAITLAEQFAPESGSVAEKTSIGTPLDVAWTKTSAWRKAEIPAANGHGNARSMARAQTAMACSGSAFGVELMSSSGTKRVLEEQSNGTDLFLGMDVRFGMGYGLVNPTFPFSKNPNTCFWGGYGGSVVIIDQDAHVCVTFAMNKMRAEAVVGDVRSKKLLGAVYDAL
jgi:CubicO group peptidase (beta-lactamase class C family)